MVSRTKLALLTAAVLVPVLLIAVSMSLVLAGEDEFDVEVNKWGTESYVIAGEDFTYNVRVWNFDSGVTATNVLVTDTLPPQVEYVVDPNGCSENSPGVLTCPLDDMSPGEQTYFDITVHIAADAYDPEDPEIWNLIEVSATTELGGGDTQDWNNMVNRGLDIQEQADLTMEKAVFPGDVVPVGEWFSYTLWVQNLGPSVSREAVVMDWFATDGSLTAVSADDEGPYGMCGPMPTDQGWAETPAWLLNWVDAVCDLTGDPYFCDAIEPWWEAWWAYWYNSFPPNYPYPLAVDWMCIWYTDGLEPGEPFPLTVDVLPLDAQTIYNQAWVVPDMYPYNWFEEWYDGDGWGTPDPDPYNNMDELVTQVTDEADLSVVKFSKPDEVVQAGEFFTYTIFVENLGPAPAYEVSIRDEMLSEGSFVVDHVILDPDREDEGPIVLPSPEGGMTMEFHLHEPLEPKGPDNQGRWVIQIVLQADETQDVNNLVEVFTREGGSSDPDLSNNQDEDSISVADVADLSLAKSAVHPPPPPPPPTAPFFAGDDVLFRLQVTNNGPSTAENVVLEDMLPEGVAVVNVDPGPGSCTTGVPGSEPLRCNLGTLGIGASATVRVTALIDPAYMGDLENDAVVYSDIYDDDNSNNRASIIVAVQTRANLTLDKIARPPFPWYAGEIRTYEYHIENQGPSVSRDVRLRDFLPAQVDFVSAYAFKEGSTGGIPLPCDVSTPNVLICPLGDIPPTVPPGVVVLVDVRIKPEVPDGTPITNGAALTSDTPDPSAASDSELVLISNWADLSIRKTADPYKVFAGEQVRYDISVTNNGPGNAFNVMVTDTLPISVTYEIDTDDCLQVGETNTYTCTLGTIPPGETHNFSIFARVEPDAPLGPVSNVAMVDSPSDPYNWPEDYNDRATAPNLIQGRADLKIQKFGKPDGLVRAGDKLTYTIIVDNLGTGYAHNVTLDDVLKSDGWFDLMQVTSDRPALCDPATGTFQHDLHLTCALSDTLEVKGPTPGSGRWMITVIVIANEPQDINNVAYVAGSDYDPDLSNNEAMAEHEITAVADLELTKEAWGEMRVGCDGETELWLNEVAAGGMVTYTLTVSNTGPSTAENVMVLDEPLPLPELLEIDVQSISPSQGNCQTGHIVDQRRLSCNLGTIKPTEAVTVTFVAHVPSWVPDGTVLVNDAQAYSDMFDGNNGNDVVTNHTIVSRVADLDVDKTQEPETTLPGLEVVYTIVVTNTGPSDAHGVMISDTLPFNATSLTVEGCASDGGQCDVPCEVPTCPAGECPWPEVDFIAQADIPADGYVIYTLTAIPEWVPCEMITNTVQVSLWYEDVIDPCPGNDVAWTESDPECNFVPLALKSYPGPDSPP